MIDWFFWLFRCWWAGHKEFKHVIRDGYARTVDMKLTRCFYCDKVLDCRPVHRSMKVQVEILEDDQ
jgi:hypothetical protein